MKIYKKILDRAKYLLEHGIYWHHHVFFPKCAFNKHEGKWNIAFEDPEHNKIIESFTDHEDEKNQSKVEKLYYEQEPPRKE